MLVTAGWTGAPCTAWEPGCRRSVPGPPPGHEAGNGRDLAWLHLPPWGQHGSTLGVRVGQARAHVPRRPPPVSPTASPVSLSSPSALVSVPNSGFQRSGRGSQQPHADAVLEFGAGHLLLAVSSPTKAAILGDWGSALCRRPGCPSLCGQTSRAWPGCRGPGASGEGTVLPGSARFAPTPPLKFRLLGRGF